MIGEVSGRKAGVMIDEHFFDGLLRLDVAVRAGYLPHSVEDSAMVKLEVNSNRPVSDEGISIPAAACWSFLSP